jgi:hypothetical protein
MKIEDVKRINLLAENLFKEGICSSIKEAVEKAKKMILEEDIRQGFAEKEIEEANKDIDKIQDKLSRSIKDDEDLE